MTEFYSLDKTVIFWQWDSNEHISKDTSIGDLMIYIKHSTLGCLWKKKRKYLKYKPFSKHNIRPFDW